LKVRYLSIRWRIALAWAVPTLGLLVYMIAAVVGYQRDEQGSERVKELVRTATATNALVHALQIERGTSGALLGSGTAEFHDALNARRSESDQARTALAQAVAGLSLQNVDPDLRRQIHQAGMKVDALATVRQAVTARGITPLAVVDAYGDAVADLIYVANHMLVMCASDLQVARRMGAYADLMQAKELAGLERGIGAIGFATGRFDVAMRSRLLALRTQQDSYFGGGKWFAMTETMAQFDTAWTASDAAMLATYRRIAQTGIRVGSAGAVSAQSWLALTSKRINAMRDAEKSLTQGLITLADEAKQAAQRATRLVALLGLAALVLTLWMAQRLARDIVLPLRSITRAMDTLAKGEAQVDLDIVDRVDEIGEMLQAMAVFRENLARVMQGEAARASSAVLLKTASYQRALLDNFPFEVWLKDIDGVYLAANRVAATALGLSSVKDVVGKTSAELCTAPIAAREFEDDQRVMASRQTQVVERHEVDASAGRDRWVETYKTPIVDDSGNLLGTVGFSRDITERKRAHDEILQLALYDALTKLPNRRLLQERLSLAVMQGRRDRAHLALIFVDLDKFKPVNDTLGHAVGDLLLTEVGQRLHQCVREADTVARVGGDEFVVLLTGISEVRDVLHIAEKIRESLNLPFDLAGGHRVSISSSSGVAIFPQHGADETALAANADRAMYQAKRQGRNRVVVFDPDRDSAPP
jgi:diguanylate cyclase (GGDEF)-like protein/PAS domain S-box-containing protein